MFIWTRRMHFWQFCCNNLIKQPIVFAKNSRMLKKCLVFPEKKTFFQKFLWWRRRRFRKEGQRNSAKSKKLLAQNHELTKKIPNLYFSTKRSSGRVNTVQSTSESSKFKYCSLEMYFSSKIYSAEPVPILETLLRKWKKCERISVKLSLHTQSAVLERTQSSSCFLPEVPEHVPQNMELKNLLFST